MRDCDNPNLKERKLFSQPVVQTVQMFIGEMGSWLFVGGFALYKRYISGSVSAEEGGYQPLDTNENGDADSVRSSTPINPVAKALAPNSEHRLPLKGWKVILLSLPAICDICESNGVECSVESLLTISQWAQPL